MIGGNKTAIIQTKSTIRNEIGESASEYTDEYMLKGWLDFSAGSSNYNYNGKFQDSTHIFICDYQRLDIEPNECRLICDGKIYEVLIIDDPMGLHEQLEFLLKYIGVNDVENF